MWRPSPRPDNRALQEIRIQLNRIEEKVDKIMSEQTTQQADIDAATAAINNENASVQAVADDLAAGFANIQAEIEALKAANPAVDTTALDAAVSSQAAALTALQTADANVDSLETPAETPAPDAPTAA